jgi:hypothetical protein
VPDEPSDRSDVLIETADGVVHRLPEETAVRLAKNLRTATNYAEVCIPTADKIEAALAAAKDAPPVRFTPEEAVSAAKALDENAVGDRENPDLWALSRSLWAEDA